MGKLKYTWILHLNNTWHGSRGLRVFHVVALWNNKNSPPIFVPCITHCHMSSQSSSMCHTPNIHLATQKCWNQVSCVIALSIPCHYLSHITATHHFHLVPCVWACHNRVHLLFEVRKFGSNPFLKCFLVALQKPWIPICLGASWMGLDA